MLEDYRIILNKIVYKRQYESMELLDDDLKDLKLIYDYFKNSDNFIGDLRNLLVDRNNENEEIYNEYISEILQLASVEIRIELLNLPVKYGDIIKDDRMYINVFMSLPENERLRYLHSKKKYDNIDSLLINEWLKECSVYKDNIILREIMEQEKMRNKIEPYSLWINYSPTILKNIDLSDFLKCSIINKECYTKLLLKKCKNFKDFKKLYNQEKKIINLIAKSSLAFKSKDNEDIYRFLLEEPNFIGKFNGKYLDLFNVLEIDKISKIKTLDSDSYSSILEKLFVFNKDKANEYFSEDSLRKCPKHSLKIYPFAIISEDLRNVIFNTYTLFNRFIDSVVIEAINSFFAEDDIVNLLRNDNFVNDMSSYGIELMLNRLSFRSTFNMLQRKSVLDKIKHLNVTIYESDAVFIKSFLDSPMLVSKSNHEMIFEMAKCLNKNDIIYYLTLPYIVKRLSNYEIVRILSLKKMTIKEILGIENLLNKLQASDLITLIDENFKNNIDLEIFKNKKLSKLLFNIDDETFEMINFDEVNYLFETICMKAMLSKQNKDDNFMSYKSVLISYMLLGLSETLKVVNNGNKNLSLDILKKRQTEIVEEQILRFKENNENLFQDLPKKLIDNLNMIEDNNDLNDFIKRIKDNVYIDNVIYMMLENNFDTYNNIIRRFYDYLTYSKTDNYQAYLEIYNYTKDFLLSLVLNKRKEYNDVLTKITLNNFKLKDSIIYKEKQKEKKEFIKRTKLKIFTGLVIGHNEEYEKYLCDGYNCDNLQDKYLKHLNITLIDLDNILEHILIPTINERFNKENCLNKLGIFKPKEYDKYMVHQEDLRNLTILNNSLGKLKDKFSLPERLEILNYICYGTSISFKIKKKDKSSIDKNKVLADSIYGELYVDKINGKLLYGKDIDVYDIAKIIEYNNYLDIIEDILKKTDRFLIKAINEDKVKNDYIFKLCEETKKDNKEYPLTNKYYELFERVFTLGDICKIFNGYELKDYKKIDEDLLEILNKDNNIVMVALGYYDDLVDNLGVIISHFADLKAYYKEKDKDIKESSLIELDDALRVIKFNKEEIVNYISKDVINTVINGYYYQKEDLNKRLEKLGKLYKERFKIVKSSIPFLCYRSENITIKTIDRFDDDVFKTLDNTHYGIGMIGEEFFKYSVCDMNGYQIGIYENDLIIAKILGIRNGNTLYLNGTSGKNINKYEHLLKDFANDLIEATKDDNEPINFVTIVNNENYTSYSSLKIDSTICPFINCPFTDEIRRKMYTNYGDAGSTLLASNIVVDKINFKSYDAEGKYLRKRNDVIKLGNNMLDKYINKYMLILNMYKDLNNDVDIKNISLSEVKAIYLGDDFVLLVLNNGNVINYVLPYDKRANKEIDLILEKLKSSES